MTKLVVHIGHQKTGTSAIQKFLSESAEILSASGLVYPKATRNHKIAHHDLRTILEGGVQSEIDYVSELFLEECQDAKTIIISSEGLARIKKPELFKELFPYVDDIQVVYFVRDPLELLISGYRQLVKASIYSESFRSYIDQRSLDLERVWMNWKKLTSNISLELYNYTEVRSDIVNYFCKILDLPLNRISEGRNEANPSINGTSLIFKLYYNLLVESGKTTEIKGIYKHLEELTRYQSPKTRNDFSLSNEIYSKIKEFNAQDYDFLEKIFPDYVFENNYGQQPATYTAEELNNFKSVFESQAKVSDYFQKPKKDFSFLDFDSVSTQQLHQRLINSFD
jgi:hypothetical protein